MTGDNRPAHKAEAWRWAAVAALICLLALAASIYPASDPDLYIMLATGRYVAQTGQAPTVDLWSHTAYGQPWQMHEWLGALIFYGLFSVWGISGIIIFKAALLAAAFALALSAMRLKGVSPGAALAVSALALLAVNYGFAERIQIFAFFFLVLIIYWLELWRQKKVPFRIFFPIVLAVLILWANIHITYVFGLFILGLYLLDDAWGQLRGREWSGLGRSFLKFAAAFVATGANPYGFYHAVWALSYYFRPELQKADAQIYTSILEYQPLLSPGLSREPLVIYGLLWISFSLLGILLGWRRLKISFAVLWLLFTYWAVGYVRFLWMQVFITIIGVGWHWQGAVDHLIVKSRIWNSKFRMPGNAIFVGLVVLILAGAGLYQRSGKHLWQRVELGWRPRMQSERGAEFLKANLGGGKLFNDFDIGGYLLWKQIPVFVDGRIAPYFGTEVLNDHHRIYQGNLALLDHYGIDWLMLPYAKTSQTDFFDRFNRVIVASGRWVLVYWDDACLIYVRDDPRYQGVIDRHRYRYVNPAAPDLSLPPEKFLGELNRKLAEEPGSLMPHTLAGNYFFHHNDPAMAEKEFRAVLASDPYNPMMYNNLGNAYLRQGRVDEAIKAYQKAVKLDVNLGLAYSNWGYVMEAKGETKEAIRLYTIATKVAPGDAWPYNRLGHIAMKQGNREKALEYWRKGAQMDPSGDAAKSLRENFSR